MRGDAVKPRFMRRSEFSADHLPCVGSDAGGCRRSRKGPTLAFLPATSAFPSQVGFADTVSFSKFIASVGGLTLAFAKTLTLDEDNLKPSPDIPSNSPRDDRDDRAWRRGDRLSHDDARSFRNLDWRDRGLSPPPAGYQYLQDDRGACLLVGMTTGLILSVSFAD